MSPSHLHQPTQHLHPRLPFLLLHKPTHRLTNHPQIDQGIQAPIFTVVIFSYLDFLEGKNLEETLAQIKRDLWPCLVKNWK